MKKITILLILIFTVFSPKLINAQQGIESQLATVNVDDLSDQQISSYWNKAKSEGYTMDQLAILAKAKGMSASQVSKLKQRINALKYTSVTTGNTANSNDAPISNLEKFGLQGKSPDEVKKNALFGYDFFSNPNISFTPNLNLATPTTYQLGPGDEILIDIWGASQNNYRNKVDRDGAIRIDNIGPIYISGLSIEKASAKIRAYLKKIYSGIGAPNNSNNKVYAGISLVGVRSVQVNIIGEVKVPGTYTLSALSSVLNALYAAGGPTKNGTFREVNIIRNGKPYQKFDIYKYLIDGSEEGNVLLQDQDIIIIKPYISKIQVTGKIKRPGIYELKNEETIKDLIGFFGGFTADAYQDRLLVERVNGTQREVSEILQAQQKDFELKDGDNITVGAVIDRFKNRVSIGGAIYRPGNYELTNKLTLSGLLEKAMGLKDDAFLDRGIIYRSVDGVKQEVIPFSVRNIISKTSDISLKRADNIHIFSIYNLKEKQTVSIDGAINNPKAVDFKENMSIEDLIAMAGGYSEGADPNVIDISRMGSDGNYKIISKNIKKSSTNNLMLDDKAHFYLQAFDRVSVRYIPGFTKQQNVSIQGEISRPGIYAIGDKDERISDLVTKAGGFSPYAYVKGATLIRKINKGKDTDKEQLKLLENLGQKGSLVDIKPNQTEFKIGINLVEIMAQAGQKSNIDLILEAGDILMVPAQKQTVEVRGEVLSPSLSRFDKSNSFKEYINSSGGFTDNAKFKNSYVVYANGDIKSIKRFLFFKSYPKIEPGAVIIVPKKGEAKNKMTLQEAVTLTTGLSTLGILLKTFIK
ncbi:MAG: SLBB domain-containing protein [Flavobacteriales bacterium]|nr:SLBB domain-containing protein [Flavobacteriales bacterium]